MGVSTKARRNIKTGIHGACKRILTASRAAVLVMGTSVRVIVLVYWLMLAGATSKPCYSQGTSFSFEHISTKDGLMDPNVYCSLQDSYGFMWFGTLNGLTRFDGYRYVTFKLVPEDSTSLPFNQVSCILETTEKNLYIGCIYGGFCRFNREKETFERYFNLPCRGLTPEGREVSCIYQDKKGNVWVGTNDGLIMFDQKTLDFVVYYLYDKPSRDLRNCISDIVEDRDGNLWLLGVNNKIAKFDPSQKSFEIIQYKQETWQSQAYSKGELIIKNRVDLWICSGHGLYRMNIKTRQIESFANVPSLKNATNFRTSLEDSRGNLWFGTDGAGLFMYDGQRGTFDNITHDNAIASSLSSNAIYSIFEDNQKTLWVGTYAAGINCYNPHKCKMLAYSDNTLENYNLSQRSVLSICQVSADSLWLGTDGGGIDVYRPSLKTIKPLFQNLGSAADLPHIAKSMIVDHRGLVWVGTYGKGIYVLNKKGIVVDRFTVSGPPGKRLRQDNVWSFCFDKENNLMICYLHFGFDTYDFNTRSLMVDTLLFKNSGYERGTISNTLRDSRGRLWLVVSNVGVFMSKTGGYPFRFIDFAKSKKVTTSNSISCVFEDSQGTIWMGSLDGGLYKVIDLEQNLFEAYNKNNGFPTNDVVGILEDSRNCLWLSTLDGLYTLDPVTRKTRSFDREDGVQCERFNFKAVLKDAGGNMYFGGVEGLNVINITDMKFNTREPKIIISSLNIYNTTIQHNRAYGGRVYLTKPMYLTDTLVFTHNDYMFSLEFAALDFLSPAKNSFKYMLGGFDKEWIYTDASKRVATYTKLAPGTYQFCVKASNNDGVWNDKGTTVTIVVLPPWWQTWWIRTVLILLVLAVFSLVLVLRTMSFKNQKIKLEAMVQNRTSELHKANDELMAQKREIVEKSKAIEGQNANLEEAYRNLQDTQNQLVVSEKMAALGQLIAGIAHEINTPLGAIKTAITNINESKKISLTKLPLLMKKMSDHEISIFIDLITLCASKHKFLSTREERSIRTNVVAKLDSYGIANAEELADILVDIGLHTNLERFYPLFMSEIAEEVFATAYHMAIQEKNAMVIISAIERASKIVFALKSYAHTVNSETISAIEICGSIDLVLTLYRNQLKYGIELVRDYTTEAIVNCYPDELNQVWTNIIHNAIHAMNGTGRLVVGVRVVDEQVVVSFSDTGRGIPDDIKPRVFEPFFTTKKAGEGTGMGLSIVKKIVEKHKGTIDFESSEGTGTIFYVHLPRDTNQGN